MSEQKRQHVRVSARARVRLPDYAFGTTRDISPSGVFLFTTTPFEVGEELRFSIEFDVPDAGGVLYLDCVGSVARVETGGTKLGIALTITESKLVRREWRAAGASVSRRTRAEEGRSHNTSG